MSYQQMRARMHVHRMVCIVGLLGMLLLSACSFGASDDPPPSVGDTTAATAGTTGASETTTAPTAMATTGTTSGGTAPTAPAVPGDAASGASEVSIADIVANPESYLGRTVTVVSTPLELLGDRAFRLNASDSSAGAAPTELLVVTATNSLVSDTMINQPIRVTGIVTKLNLPALEQQLGVDLDDSLFESFVDQPVLVATAVEAA